MGMTLQPIPFFVDTITIVPHTASDAAHLCRPVSIAEFAQGGPVSLAELSGGELRASTPSGRFIEGPEQDRGHFTEAKQ